MCVAALLCVRSESDGLAQMHTGERKRPKDERDLINRVKPFARIQTSADYEEFLDGLMCACSPSASLLTGADDRTDELMLRKRINELQEYRKVGLTTLADADRYEKEKVARVRAAVLAGVEIAEPRAQATARANGNYKEMMLVYKPATRGPGSSLARPYDSREGTPQRPLGRKANQALSLANSSSLQLLSLAEQRLCSDLRILPKPFLFIKQTLLREFARREGRLRKAEARELLHIDGDKLERIWDLVIGDATVQQVDAAAMRSVEVNGVNGMEVDVE